MKLKKKSMLAITIMNITILLFAHSVCSSSLTQCYSKAHSQKRSAEASSPGQRYVPSLREKITAMQKFRSESRTENSGFFLPWRSAEHIKGTALKRVEGEKRRPTEIPAKCLCSVKENCALLKKTEGGLSKTKGRGCLWGHGVLWILFASPYVRVVRLARGL